MLMADVVILVLLFFLVSSLQVRIANAEPKTITVPDNYATIQTAVRNAFPGDTVFVKNGTYNVDDSTLIVIDRTLSLIGEGSANTIISGLFNIHSSVGTPALRVAAPNVTISGFTITNCKTGIAIANYNSEPYPSGCKIIGNNIIDNFEGIRSQRSDLLISENNITGNTEGGIMGSGTENVTISSNNIDGNEYGVNIKQCKNITVENNTVFNNTIGLNLASYGFHKVYRNNIARNDVGIMFAEGCNNATVYENNLTENNVGVELLNFPYAGVGGFAVMGVGNIVCANNIVGNIRQAVAGTKLQFEFIERSSNGTDIVSWDNGSVGNFWSDFQSRYPNASEAGSSGVWNTPYTIDAKSTDHYPLMSKIDITATAPNPTQTPIATPTQIPSQTSNSTQAPSPSIPEFQDWIVLPALLVASALAVTVIKRKTR
jgi:parallel beta-helix repeat protein